MTATICTRTGCGHDAASHGTIAGCLIGGCTCLDFQGQATPYDGGTSSGHSGSATSHQRALREDGDGTTAARQGIALQYLSEKGAHGLTVKDVRETTGWHHGQASAALSNLHQAGTIVRLAETRDRCKVYVLPQYVADRATEAHGTRGKAKPGTIRLSDEERATLRRLRLALPVTIAAADPNERVTVTLLRGTAADLAALVARINP